MNLDYIVLVEGGLLFVAAIGAAAVGRNDHSWRWLALFALMQAVARWIDIASVDSRVPAFLFARTALLVIGLAGLVEFAGRHRLFREPWPRVWIYAGAAPLMLGTVARFGRSYGVVLLLLLAAAGAVWTSTWLWRRAHASAPDNARRLRLVAILLVPFTTVSFLPPAVFETLGISEIGRQFQLLELGLAVTFAATLYFYCAVARQRLLSVAAARSWRRRRYVCTAVVFGVVIAGTIVAEIAGHRKDAAMRQQVLLRTQLAAVAMDPALVQALQWNDTDLSAPGYMRLKALITLLRLSNPDLRFAMLTGFDHGRTFFLADSEPPSSKDYSPPGQAYDEAEPEYVELLAQRRPFVLGPIADRWGTWVTGSVPILELAPGRAVNFELDIAAEQWAAEIRQARLPVVFIVLLICLLIVGSFEAQERLHESTARIAAARDTAEAATRAKSEFLAVMSHELRTPLAGVIGVIDLLGREPPKPLRQQYVAVAADSAHTLLRLLDDILDTAKIEAGKLRLEEIPFRPREEFKYICEAARLRATTRGLDFTYAIDPHVPETLVGDPTRLRQVIGNLQNNALKFTETGGIAVTIDCERAAAAVRLRISVRDTGAGIDKPTLKRLFNKFEQADASTTRRYGGTGLGLSIVKALADAMGGTVTVDSELGRGSTFTFTAPLRIATVDPAAPVLTADASGESVPFRLRILCAEDDAVNRLVAEGLLRDLGQAVEFAENGRVAVDRLCRESFDLVLMDGRMPVLDGIKAVQLIRDPHTNTLDPEIYICALTANASEVDRQRCLAHGMNDYISKPMHRAAIIAVLHRAAAHLRSRDLPVAAVDSPAPLQGLSEAELLALLDEQPPPTASESVKLPPGTLERLSALFRGDAPQRVATIRTSLARGDATAVADAAHALKSSAHYVEAFRLSKLAAEIEAEAERGHLGTLEPLVAQLERELEAHFARETSVSVRSISP